MEPLEINHHDAVPITAYFSKLQKSLSESSSDSERIHLIGCVERIFKDGGEGGGGGGPGTSLLPTTDDHLAEYCSAYKSLLSTLIGCAALPDCEEESASLPPSSYQDVPSRAEAVCSALTAMLGLVGRGGVRTDLLLAVAPDVCVFSITHLQVSVCRDGRPAAEAPPSDVIGGCLSGR